MADRLRRRDALLVRLGAVVSPLGAQPATPVPSSTTVVGSWLLTVAPPHGKPHAGLPTFAADGTLTVADMPVQPAPPGNVLFIRPGHGAWAPAGVGVDFTLMFLVADNAGAPVGTLTLRGTATLEAVGQRLSATYYTLTFADPAGHVVSTAPGTCRGTRLTVAPAGTPVT